MRIFALTVAAVLLACEARAAADVGALRASGDWRLTEPGGRVACTLTFTRQTSFAGYELKAPLACRRAFPPLKLVAAWAMDGKGAIVLSDAHAQPIVTFPAQAKGPYEAKAPDGRTWRLEPLRSDHDAAGAGERPISTAPPFG
jgi:hypothetical protein